MPLDICLLVFSRSIKKEKETLPENSFFEHLELPGGFPLAGPFFSLHVVSLWIPDNKDQRASLLKHCNRLIKANLSRLGRAQSPSPLGDLCRCHFSVFLYAVSVVVFLYRFMLCLNFAKVT